MTVVPAIFLAIAMLFLASGRPSFAQPIESAYTDLDLDKCRHTPGRAPEDYGFCRCKGHAGVIVHVSAADQRTLVSFGPNAAHEPAASQTFPNFNSVGPTKIEWRTEKRKGPAKPFATIVRWNVKLERDETNPSSGRVLVVTRLGKGVCHVGYVDGLANPDANALAREIADKHARTFDCPKGKRMILGKRGESIANIAQDIDGNDAGKAETPSPGSSK